MSDESEELSQFQPIEEILEQTNKIIHTKLQGQDGNHPRAVKRFKH